MKHVYISHPLGKDLKQREINRIMASHYAAWAALHGCVPVCSWIVLALTWGEHMRELGMKIDLSQINRCDELWICGTHISPGMMVEIEHAGSLGLQTIDKRFALKFDEMTGELIK